VWSLGLYRNGRRFAGLTEIYVTLAGWLFSHPKRPHLRHKIITLIAYSKVQTFSATSLQNLGKFINMDEIWSSG
jgi:hypothetical protein